MIKAVHINGREMAECTCDDCGVKLSFAAQHVTSSHGWKPSQAKIVLESDGKAIAKAQSYGWAYVKGVLRCDKCEAKRKSKQEAPMPTVVTPNRQPTREDKRQIVELLTFSYDTTAGRYRGSDTDKTIAEVLGGSVMPGWVAEIREELFGPDGGNAELDTLAAEVAKWADEFTRRAGDVDKRQADLTTALREFRDHRDQASAIVKRIEALKKAIGPKAASA
jgi:hypothetical protein